ncbi:PE family protein, partial [Mycobacterium basiliense]
MSSYVIAVPEALAAAATDFSGIGEAVRRASAAAAGSTTNLLAAGADEVSAAIAGLFGSHAQEYQALSAQVTVFHDRFVQTIAAGSGAYAAAEAANASLLQTIEADVLAMINAPTKALFGRALIGDGANGAAGSGQAGGAGGLLWGNGG